MIEIKSEKYTGNGQKLPLGRQGENLARRVSYNISDLKSEFGAGTVKWIVKRSGDTVSYEAANTEVVDDISYLNLTSVETARAGKGGLELWYETETARFKTSTWITEITPTISE